MNELLQISTRRGRITLVLMAMVLIAIAGGIILVVSVASQYSLVAAGALITAWATLGSAIFAQLATTWRAADRAQVEALQAYLKEMGELLSNNPGVRDKASADNDDLRTLARAHTLTVLSNLNPDRQELVNNYLRDVQLLDALELYLPDTAAHIIEAYLDYMNNLLHEGNLRNSVPDSEVRTLAQGHTLRVLRSLDPRRKTEVMRFLIEAGLVQGSLNEPDVRAIDNPPALRPVVSLRAADLHGISLPGANLMRAHLASTNLTGADLSEANLRGADLNQANLSGATMPGGSIHD